MPESRYDVVFAGQLVAGADAATVRMALQTQFKLTDALLDRLFSGQRVAVKRGLELPAAQRYCELFAHAGAVLELVAMPAVVSPPAPVAAVPVPPSPVMPAPLVSSAPPPASFTLAPVGSTLEELTDGAAPRNPNTSHLSLVAGEAWTLEDCAPPPLAQPLPDIDSLMLEPLAPRAIRRDE
ncbi:hypothetical protein HUU61_00315 [Rhodopseudomonas palustris]|uniref:Uncharacterized protein n=1 Tax=Thiospirillum jenense TaxID=1653858 RepID=A0A839H5H6_9GAMM|nr:hypothetical protein [Thiospirillum jenense]MBB1089722.1 hypothetical protein [Rhodopseudomonas palustris]MBB1124824.1 hypothetical protein [Thiospirillum jenense]